MYIDKFCKDHQSNQRNNIYTFLLITFFLVAILLAMPSSGLEPETSPLPRECSTAELQGQFESGPGWTIQECLQHSNSEVCRINLDRPSVDVKLFLGSAVIILQSTF